MNALLSSAEVMSLVNSQYSMLGKAANCKLLRRGFNDSYLVGIDNEWYIFRVYLNGKYYIESPDAFEFELELLEHLLAAGVPVSVAKQRDNSELLGWTPTARGERAYALFTYAKGEPVTGNTQSEERCFLVGKAAAGFHLAANSFRTNHNRYRLDRKYLVDEPLRIIAQQHIDSEKSISKQRLEKVEEKISAMQPLEELIEIIESLDVANDEFGIIHADLHPGNIHFDGDKPTFFDFDHCAFGWRAYELCMTEYMPEPMKVALLKGYESIRPLSQSERQCIPVFAKLRELWDIGDSLAIDRIIAE